MNYKFDIKKITEQFNACEVASCEISKLASQEVTHEEMSEMIQRHAFKLGCDWKNYGTTVKYTNYEFLFIDDKNLCVSDNNKDIVECKNKEIGLEFFSIKPEPKTVTVRMPKGHYNYICRTIEKPFDLDTRDWKLIK